MSRSGFYDWLSKGCPVDVWDDAREAVRRVWLESDRRFGARFVRCFLPPEHARLTLYRVRKLMRELGIRGCTPYKSKRTTIPDRNARPRPDLVGRNFTSPAPTYKLVGRTGNCHDNAVAESFFATLKNEMYYRTSFATRAMARHAVVDFIERYYNRRRPHSTIGYQVPAEAMEAFFARTAPKPEALPMAT